jgi:hypothetical protein
MTSACAITACLGTTTTAVLATTALKTPHGTLTVSLSPTSCDHTRCFQHLSHLTQPSRPSAATVTVPSLISDISASKVFTLVIFSGRCYPMTSFWLTNMTKLYNHHQNEGDTGHHLVLLASKHVARLFAAPITRTEASDARRVSYTLMFRSLIHISALALRG